MIGKPSISVNRLTNSKETVPYKSYFKPLSYNFFEEAGIPKNLSSYSIEKWGPKIQDWLNVHYPGFKLFCFNEKMVKKNLWEAQFAGDVENFNVGVPIFYYTKNDIGHYCGVRNINSLFYNSKYYCFHCQTTYDSSDDHSVECKAKCKSCSLVGDGPCKRDPNFLNEICPDCNRVFRNQECFERHKKIYTVKTKIKDDKTGRVKFAKIQTTKCDHVKGCKKCGQTYYPRKLAKNGLSGRLK